MSDAAILVIYVCLLASDAIDAKSKNLALGKPSQQSSYFELKGVSSHAVDGNADPYYHNGSCTHTQEDYPSWWLVDLQDKHLITAVEIVNRDSCGHRLANFTIEVSVEDPRNLTGFPGDTATSQVCARQVDPVGEGEVRSFPCRKPVWGRYIRVVKFNDIQEHRALTLCEFRAFNLWEFTLELVSSLSSSTQPIKTVPEVRSSLECARTCMIHPGPVRCHVIQFHSLTGECQLLESHTVNNLPRIEGWNVYKVKYD